MNGKRSVYLLLLVVASSLPATAQNHTWDFNLGVGPMAGHTTYQIGGTVTAPEGVEEYWFPISELVFPMQVAQITLDSTLSLGKEKRLQLALGATKNLTTDAGTMEDSDWMTGSNPDQLDVFSESQADLDALMLNADILYKFLKRKRVSLGAGVGFLYQDFNYECSDFDQWYPSQPWWGHDYGWGLGIIYEITYYIPYLQLRTDVSFFSDKLQLGVMLGASPYVTAEDYDNHVLRGIVSYGDFDGVAGLMSLEATLYLLKHWFLEVRLDARTIAADGTQRNYIGGAWSHDIDTEITSDQGSFTFAVGASF